MSVTTANGVSATLVQPAVYRGAVAPTNASLGDLWEDLSTDPPVLRQCIIAPDTFAAVAASGGFDPASPGPIGGTTPAAGTFTTLTATGQTSLGGAAGSADAVRIYCDNTIAGTTVSFTAPALSFIPPQSGFGAGLLRSSTQLNIGTGSTSPLVFQTAATLGFSGVEQFRIAHTASAVNYVQITGAATGSQPVISTQGSDATIPFFVRAKGTTFVYLQNASGTTQFSAGGTSVAVNYLNARGGATGFAAQLETVGTDANAALAFLSKGTGIISFATNTTSANEQLRVAHTASAVNYVQVTGSATTPGASAIPNIQTAGSDANTFLGLGVKGTTGYIAFFGAAAPNGHTFRVSAANASTTNNLIQVNAASAGSAPSIQAIAGTSGTDANIDLALTPKGTGVVQFGSYTAGVLTPTGYITIKDSGGTVRRLLVG